MRDERPRWARQLEGYSSHIVWAVGGFLGAGILAEFATGGHAPAAVLVLAAAGAAWGFRRADRLPHG